MRLFLAMMSHETNTFSNVRTDRAQFEARDLAIFTQLLPFFDESMVETLLQFEQDVYAQLGAAEPISSVSTRPRPRPPVV